MPALRPRARRWAFDQRLNRPRRPHVVGVGDSHAAAIDRAARRLGWPSSLCTVRGATAQGLHNPNSQTDALRRFGARCDQAKRWQHLVFLLGEVDCGFVIWHRAQRREASIESQVDYSLSAYVGLLERTSAGRDHAPIVLSVSPPTVPNYQDWDGAITNARSGVTATQRERTDLTLEYNRRLQEQCARVGAVFVDVTTATLDPETQLIREEFLNPDRGNIHLHPVAFAELIATKLPPAVSAAH